MDPLQAHERRGLRCAMLLDDGDTAALNSSVAYPETSAWRGH
ncbi:MAG: hypothetical protein U5L01_09045 [Rheinheimera sp.]|nr:hypothetical protein [Rheinheimera sp.]